MNNSFFDIIFNIGLYHYLALGLLLFLAGLFGVIVSRNIIKILLNIEFMLCALNINFIAFTSYFDVCRLNGFVCSLFITVMGAVEIAVLLAIFYLMYKYKNSVDIEDYKELKR